MNNCEGASQSKLKSCFDATTQTGIAFTLSLIFHQLFCRQIWLHYQRIVFLFFALRT